MQFQPSAYESVTILVVGDSGVGKTSLVHTLCHGEPPPTTTWTVGCHCDLKLHENQSGQKLFVEFCDVGAKKKHFRCRPIFFGQPFDGIIAVHDISNRKSFSNLRSWVDEISDAWEASNSGVIVRVDSNNSPSSTAAASLGIGKQGPRFDDIPLLYVGTKSDLAGSAAASNSLYGPHADFVHVSLLQALPAKETKEFSDFYDRVIHRKFVKPSPTRARAGSLTMRQPHGGVMQP